MKNLNAIMAENGPSIEKEVNARMLSLLKDIMLAGRGRKSRELGTST